MGVSADAPFLDTAYKLVEYAGKPRLKRSPGKTTLPGRKQVFRQMVDGIAIGDTLACRHESTPGTALLRPVMLAGKRVAPPLSLISLQETCSKQIACLPDSLRRLDEAGTPYPVNISAQLDALARSIR